MVRLVTVGHVLKETIIFADGRREGPVLGGPAAYSSVAAARLGIPTGIVTKVGEDISNELLHPLKDAGVDLVGVHFGKCTTTNELVYTSDGTKELRYLKYANPITFKDIPEVYLEASLFYVCPLNYEVSLEAISHLRCLKRITAVDLGGYGGAHVCRKSYPGKKLTLAELKNLISSFDIVKASNEDCKFLFSRENLSEEESAQSFVEWGAEIGVITMGAKGSLVFTKDDRYYIPALSGEVIDVTGGGDSYMAGFPTEFIRTNDPWKSAVFASAVALCVLEKTGGVRALRMPSEEEARKRIPASMWIGSKEGRQRK